MKRLTILSLTVLFALILGACAPQATPAPVVEPPAVPQVEAEPEPMNIVSTAVDDGRFTTLVAALQAAQLDGTLSGSGPFTVFAPTDEAFAKLPAGTVDALLADIPTLTNILLYHVVDGNYTSSDVVALESTTALSGEALQIAIDGSNVRINDSQVLITDIEASNGVIHVIDTVLLPPDPPAPTTIVDVAVADGSFGTLVAALDAAGLVETLQGEGPFTVFAPTDDAFAQLPEGTVEALLADIPALSNILLYHVVSGDVRAADVVTLSSAATIQGEPVLVKVDGDTVMINDAMVTITDIEASNGVIHVIDSVLLPPDKDITQIAIEDGRFETLVAALQAADLVETLQGEGPFTVFAPTDDAFAQLPEGTVEALLANIPALTDILLYHVVPGEAYAADVVGLSSAETAQGQPVVFSTADGKVMVNGAEIVITDILATNGVIHVIDSVILPPQNDIIATAVEDGRFSTLATALTAAELVGALQGEGPFTVFAPTDEAFANLPDGTLDALLNNIPALTDILLYHVVEGRVFAADAAALESAPTLQGEAIAISADMDSVMINGAVVTQADILASNGVIHVIDAVILPPSS